MLIDKESNKEEKVEMKKVTKDRYTSINLLDSLFGSAKDIRANDKKRERANKRRRAI